MKNLLLAVLVLWSYLPATAQLVTIPDPVFVTFLTDSFPDCMNGDQLDTQCPDVLNADSLHVTGGFWLSDLTGIEHFVNLEWLMIGGENLTTVPALPPQLLELWCIGSGLTSLPALPPSLETLDCQWNEELTTLPELPTSLTHLICPNNENLTSLPELPASLTALHCWHNENLTSLPELPASLEILACYYCPLGVLPELPPGLLMLYCGVNQLTLLPELPASLVRLDCGFNYDLAALPALPASLEWLICNNTSLVELPELPGSLTRLVCNYSQLDCLPPLPMSLEVGTLENFDISNNPFTCLPNYVPAMSGPDNAQWLSYPLCDLADLDNNPYGCGNEGGIRGTVFFDLDQDCALDAGEPGIANVAMRLLDDQGDQLALTSTLANTRYYFMVEEGAYSVQMVTADMPFQVFCAVPGDLQDVTLTAGDPYAHGVDFAVGCQYDLGVQSVVTTGLVFPGQVHTLRVAAGALSAWNGLQCANAVSGTVTVHLDGPVSYVGPAQGALTPTETGPLQFTYTIADFGSVNLQQDFRLQLETDTTALAGDLVCVNVLVEPVAGDNNPDNNAYTQCHPVVNSYDPNIKQVWPMDVEPGFDGYFTYTIYFQNTGSAPAFNIRLADTLDTNLDLGTFAVSSYSHPVLTYLSGNLLTFRFNNIMLPDSTSDPDGSIGYVQYRIKPLPGMPLGTVIENTAHIFFDFNNAIVTNTTQNLFTTTTGVDERLALDVHVFPNPGSGLYQVVMRASDGPVWLEVRDLAGRRVAEQWMIGTQAVLDLEAQPAGMYLLRVWSDGGSRPIKLIKQ